MTNYFDELKDKFYTAASGDWVESIWSPVRSYWAGEEQPFKPDIDESRMPGPEEREQIDNMEKERVAEFLREIHRSPARTRRR